jgi:oxaloacetate decarboxylase alpha subunit
VNDLRNLETAVRVARRAGAHVQGAICYTISPVHTTDMYAKQAKELVEMGCHSVCLKDMAGLLHPYDAYEIIRSMKEAVKVPVQLHCHCTGGMAEMAYVKAVEAGVDVIDCAISSLSQGTSQPSCESTVATFQDSEHDTRLDLEQLTDISDYFAEVRKKYAAFEGNVRVDAGVLLHQVPGGMISNLVSQLRDQGALDKLKGVLEEIPRVRADFGYPPLVTPTSQIVGTQAVLNALFGQRYKQVTKESRAYVLGQYGASPAPVSEEAHRAIAGDARPITGRPADHIRPELEGAAKEAGSLAAGEEDVVSYVLFPQVAREFLEWRAAGAGEGASYVFTQDELVSMVGGIEAFTAIDNANPIVNAAGAETASGTSHATPAIYTIEGDTMVVAAFGFNAESDVTPPSGMTERYEADLVTEATLEAADVVQASGGATGAKSATTVALVDGIAAIVALRPV